MAESNEEKLSRVREMASGSETWDLSRNDIAALKYVLSLLRPVASVEGVVVRHHLNGNPYVAVNVTLPEDVGDVVRVAVHAVGEEK